MPRIRHIKPQFWNDEKLAPLSPIDRLVYLGLWSMADDAGRLVDNLKEIDAFIFPRSDDSSRKSLETLTRLSRITRYTVMSGQSCIQINRFAQHQRIQHPSAYTLPAPDPSVSQKPHEPLTSVSGESHEILAPVVGSREKEVGSSVRREDLTPPAHAHLIERLGNSPRAATAVTAFLDLIPRGHSALKWIAVLESGILDGLQMPGNTPASPHHVLTTLEQWPLIGMALTPANLITCVARTARGEVTADRASARTNGGVSDAQAALKHASMVVEGRRALRDGDEWWQWVERQARDAGYRKRADVLLYAATRAENSAVRPSGELESPGGSG